MSSSSTLQSPFKPWKQAYFEADGDYRKDSWVERHVGGPLYQHQQELPRLPVPDLPQTLERFAGTAEPLAKTEQERAALQQAIAKFPQQAAVLQERLLARAEQYMDSSWLQEWWNQAGYLQVRDSVVINVSYFFHFADDTTATSNIQRAATLLTGLAQHRLQVCSGQMPAETIGKKDRAKALCSTAYKYMFHATRIPQLNQDVVRVYDPSNHNHVIVARKGHFFAMEICDPVTGAVYPLPVLEQGLQKCVEEADQLENAGTELPKLGWLTSGNRDEWASARTVLLQEGGAAMENALQELESGMALICLDDVELVSRAEMAQQLLHGTTSSGGNRWFDKSTQFIVTKNGKAGFLGEHSMMDGMPCVGLANAMTELSYKNCAEQASSSGGNVATCNVRTIFTPQVLSQLKSGSALAKKAQQEHKDWVSAHSLNVECFRGYGSNYMKQAGFSPDAFVQMVMQLATFRLFKEQVGTYESTQVRPFLHGRTETTRSVSRESAAFCQRFGLTPAWHEYSNPAIRREKLELLDKAVKAHVKYMGNAAQGQGVDRHFFGLAMLLQEGEEVPDLLRDPVFARSKRWRVSTSNLTHPNFDNWGYGEVVPDGVGLSYSVHPNHCLFNVTALSEHAWTDKLCRLLEEALVELQTLIDMEKQVQNPTSKL